MLREVDPKSLLIVGLVMRLLSVFFLNVHHTIPRGEDV